MAAGAAHPAMTDLPDLLRIAEVATARASASMKAQAPGALTGKGDRDFASDLDFAIEREVRTLLAEATPRIGFLGEEESSGADRSGEFWALDPIDGTVNF